MNGFFLSHRFATTCYDGAFFYAADTPGNRYLGQVLLLTLTCAMVLRCCRNNTDAYGVYTPGHATPTPPQEAEQCRRCPRNN